MLVYVIDTILTGNNSTVIDQIIKKLSQTFAIQDLGTLSYFLGIEVVLKNSDNLFSQKKYILELLQLANLSHTKLVSSAITTNVKLYLGDNTLFNDPVNYRQLVGALLYVTLSRPDIPLLSTRFANSCILLIQIICLLLKGFFGIFKEHLTMVFSSIRTQGMSFMLTQILMLLP